MNPAEKGDSLSSSEKGRRGETRAADALQADGWVIVQKNFRGRRGEVDIIAVRDDSIWFFEVKSWSSLPIESLEHGIGTRKLGRIVGASREFLERNRRYDGFSPCYEVVFVTKDRIERIANVVE